MTGLAALLLWYSISTGGGQNMNDDVKFELNGMLFTWNESKAASNWKKHKVTFKRAAEVFNDEYAVDV